ncbi:MAG TPA: hypothetical protein VNA88_12680 [Candidatus Kapabacteria bacterium]|jgi:hypothetical protein|nr:hypothetical protein [Candidatus Kapabacteria bacterium]
MPSFVHACPHCHTSGKVHRSLARNFREKVARVLLPVYGVYRCHNCNWRGWLPRGSTSPAMRRLLIVLYSTIMLAIVAYAAVVLVENWPRPKYNYPGAVDK